MKIRMVVALVSGCLRLTYFADEILHSLVLGGIFSKD